MVVEAIVGGLAYRIRGGLGNEFVRKTLGKPAEWEIPNTYIRAIWALYVTLMLPLGVISPLIFAMAYWGVMYGYFGGQFDLTKVQNRNWNNYARLTARGMWIMTPLAVMMTILLEPAIWLAVAAGGGFVLYSLLANVVYRFSTRQAPSQITEWLLGIMIGAALCLIKNPL